MCAFRRKLMLTGVSLFITLSVLCVSSEILELNHTGASKDALCKEFLTDKEVQGQMTSLRDKATPCPCQEKIISTDYTFRQTGSENLSNTGTGSCYQEWFPNEDGVKQMCCYWTDGTLRTGSNNGGYIVPNNTPFNITDVHSNCCHGDHVLCEQFYEVIPSDDCSRYTTPVSARSYGDPTITTLNGHSYSFNGHGEYVFLITNDIEIQARTEYVTEGNVDATMFTAFVFHIKEKNISIEAHLNRLTEAIQVYNDGTLLCNSSKTPKGPCGKPPAPIGDCLMILAGDNKISIADVRGCGIAKFTKTITLTAGEMMDLKFNGVNKDALNKTMKTMKGLAGVTANDSYISRNDSKTSVNASASHLFDFGETWALRNSSESLFDYSLTGGHNFSLYNSHHTRPRFLEDLVGNLTALFKNFPSENITKFNATCRNYWDDEPNTECLLSIARNHDYIFGFNVMKIANETRRQYEITHNTPPFFHKNMSDISVIDVIPHSKETSITIDLSKYASDSESKYGLRFIIDSEIPTSDYSISAEGVFNWNFTDELRNITLTKLKIIVYDTYNKSAMYNMFVRYCGCEHGRTECTDFPEADTNSTNNILTANCYCEKGYEGTYCENKMDPCLITECYKDRCNSSVPVGENPCLPCPHGYKGDGTTCSDVDECNPSYVGTDKCDQMCNNTEGSFKCGCKNGYRLNNNNHTCDDIDECKEGIKTCSEIHHEVCVNSIGGAVCKCMPNYMRKTEKESCETIGDAAMFVGTISFAITITKETKDINKTVDTEENRKQMEETLDKGFKGTTGYLGVEVFKLSVVITNSPTGRKKREVERGKLDVDYLVKWRSISYGAENVFNDLEGSFQNYTNNNPTKTIDVDVVRLQVTSAVMEVNNGTEKGVCQVPEKSDCDTMSTNCRNTEGGFECVCKPGFRDVKLSTKYCADVNECDPGKDMRERCIGGSCLNKYGSWNCSCSSDKTWQSVGNLTYPKYRCQGNYSYIGHAELIWGGLKDTNDIKEVIKHEIIQLFRNTNVDENGTPISELMVTATVLQFNATSFENGSTLAHATYNIQIGSVVHVSNIKDILDSYDDHTSNNPNVTSLKLSVYDESDNKLCELSNNGGCDTSTTKCEQKDGNTVCTCKKGYQKKSELDKFCSDFDECTNSTYQCLGKGYCINSVGTWSCGCNKTHYQPYRKNDSIIRCMGDFQYTGEMNITTLTDKIPDSSLKSLFNTTIHNALKDKTNTVNISSSNTSVQMSDIFLYSEIVDGSINHSGGGSGAHVTTLKFIIHTGEPVLFSQMNSTYSGITAVSNIKMGIALFNENDFNLCNITGKTKCHQDSTYCRVKDGSYRCDCKAGLKNTSDPYTCDNIDECSDHTYECRNGSTCIDSIGNWSCACPTGYFEDRISSTVIGCADINECNNTKYSCDGPINTSAICHNTIGSWNCSCSQGFKLSKKGEYRQHCEDIDECSDRKPCDSIGKCSNFLGGFNCSCPQGYDLNNSTNGTFTCKDIDECNATNACIRSLSCSNTPGDWLCTCSEGLQDRKINSSSKICGGGYEYVAEIKFNLVNKTDSIEKFNTHFENKLQSLYEEAYKRKSIQIEIISTKSSSNRLLTTLTPYVTKYIIQNVEKMNKSDLQIMETYYYQNKSCSFTVCGFEKIFDTMVQFVSFTVLNNAAICETPRNVCNKDKSTCVSNDGLLDCECNKGFMKTSNNSLFCEDIDECDAEGYLCNGTASVCSNSVGAWSCDCKAGYTPITKSDHHIVCKGNTYSYPFSISLTISGSDPKNNTAIKLSIQQQLEQTYMKLLNDSDVWVEILTIDIVEVTGERRRRGTNNENKVNVTYSLHTADSIAEDELKRVNNATTFNSTIADYNMAYIGPPTSIDNSVLCSKCDSKSTNCNTTNNKVRCNCKDGFDTNNETSCEDIDECLSSSYTCGGTCTNTVGSWNCTCEDGYKTVNKSNTAVECHDPCKKAKCPKNSLCVRLDNDDGYKCGCLTGRSGIYCTTSDTTIFIAAGSTLGGVIAILVIVIIVVCRWRTAKIKEAEKIAMDHLENSRVSAFDNEYLTDQYLPNARNGSINSQRVSNGFVRNGSLQNGTRHSYDDRNGPNYAKPVKPPKPRYHTTLSDAADASRSRDSSQPFSYNVYNPSGLMRSSNQFDNRGNPNNGRSSPLPDYDAPRSPRPDYGYRDASYDSRDSGVGNGYHGNGYSVDTDFYRGKRVSSAARTGRGVSTNF